MQLSYIIAVFSATVAMAAPNPAPEEAASLEPKACLPASCQSFGVSAVSLPHAAKHVLLAHSRYLTVLLWRLRLLVCKYCPMVPQTTTVTFIVPELTSLQRACDISFTC